MQSNSPHDKYIRRCLELARKGTGKTGLNPLVGSVVLHNDRIIGEGFHKEFGGPHAEVVAINSVKNKALLKESRIYVNLEPCSHFGKTPPCSFLIRDSKIPHVIYSMSDPNPKVSGNGKTILSNSGIKITSGILEEEARQLNRRFIVNQQEQRPFIILKWAQSSDGFIDKLRKPGDPVQPNWITNQTSRMLVHKWRSEESGILAGVNTILTDDPALNVRDWSGKCPVRILFDRNGRIPDTMKVKDGSVKTLIYTYNPEKERSGNTDYFHLPDEYSLSELLKDLLEKGISSLIVEGGQSMINSFVMSDLWDEARIFTGRVNFNRGIPAPEIGGEVIFSEIFRNNLLQIRVKRKR